MPFTLGADRFKRRLAVLEDFGVQADIGLVVRIEGFARFEISHNNRFFRAGGARSKEFDIVHVVGAGPEHGKLNLVNRFQVHLVVQFRREAHLNEFAGDGFAIRSPFGIRPDFLVGAGSVEQFDTDRIIGFAIIIGGSVIDPEAHFAGCAQVERAGGRISAKSMPFSLGAEGFEGRLAAVEDFSVQADFSLVVGIVCVFGLEILEGICNFRTCWLWHFFNRQLISLGYQGDVVEVVIARPVHGELDFLHLGLIDLGERNQVHAHVNPFVGLGLSIVANAFIVRVTFDARAAGIVQLDANSVGGFAIVISGGVINKEAQLAILADVHRAAAQIDANCVPFTLGAGALERSGTIVGYITQAGGRT